MKSYIVLKPGKANQELGVPVDIWKMEHVLKRVSYAATAFGLSAASFALLLWCGLLLLIFRRNNLILMMDYSWYFILFFSGLLFLFVYLLRGVWLKDDTKLILAYPNAFAYYRQCADVSRGKIIFGIVLCITGGIFQLCAPGYFLHGDLRVVSSVCMVAVAVGVFCTASLFF